MTIEIDKACELADELEQAFNTATGSVRLNTPKPYVLWWPNGHPTFIAVPQDRSYGHKEAQRDGQIVADFTLAGDKWAALFALIIKRMPAILERLRTSPSPTREAVLEEAAKYEKAGAPSIPTIAADYQLAETVIANWCVRGDKRTTRQLIAEGIALARALSPSPEPIVGQTGESRHG